MFRDIRTCTSSSVKGMDPTAKQLSSGPKTVSRKGASSFIEADKLGT